MRRVTRLFWIGFLAPTTAFAFAACADEGDGETQSFQADASTIIDAQPEATPDADASNDGAVADGGVERCSTSGLCRADLPLSSKSSVTSVWGSGATDVWAVGNQGLIAHFDGSRWEVADSEAPDGSLVYTARGVWLERPDDVWIVEGDRIRHGTGWKGPSATTWSTFRYPTVSGYVSYLPGTVRGLGDSVWVGYLQNYDHTPVERFSGWVDGKPGTPEPLAVWNPEVRAITTAHQDELWFAGACNRAKGHSCAFQATRPQGNDVDGGFSSWEVTEYDARTELPLTGAWAHGEEVWLVGEGGSVRRVTASTRPTKKFDFVASPVTTDLHGIFGFGPDDVWVVGDAGTVLHWDGTSWTKLATPRGGTNDKPILRSVWGSSPNDVWIAGDGTVLHFQGGAQ